MRFQLVYIYLFIYIHLSINILIDLFLLFWLINCFAQALVPAYLLYLTII